MLDRMQAPVMPALMAKAVTGKTVLVTGAGGSIGSEICRQVLAFSPAQLVMLDASELALFNIDRELKATSVLADCTRPEDMAAVFAQYEPDTVYHAAAYKHVAMSEKNRSVVYRTNVVGTETVLREAAHAEVDTFVFISTDKAVNPTCWMGITKKVAEGIARAYRATVVRFGNVIGSSGSVIPLFEQQIAAGQPVTVTHVDVTRYFMTAKEAAQLAVQAGALCPGTYVLDMGDPVRIVDLALSLGAEEIIYTGLTPGEKMHEELFRGKSRTTAHPCILEDVF